MIFNHFSSPGGIQIYYSIYHAALPASLGVNTEMFNILELVMDQITSIFLDRLLSRITDTTVEIGDQIYRPFLYDNQVCSSLHYKVGSFVSSKSANRGVPTRFSNNNNVSPAQLPILQVVLG